MSVKPVEYHQGAIADVKRAVTWYRKRSPKAALDFIDELHRAADTIREAPERWPLGKNNTRRFLLWRFRSRSSTRKANQQSQFGLSLTAAGDLNIGKIGHKAGSTAVTPIEPNAKSRGDARLLRILGLCPD